tara:strand:+ start:9773 stop:10159 length:387 start_codon:yes stop_codon:yes gene_type:complete
MAAICNKFKAFHSDQKTPGPGFTPRPGAKRQCGAQQHGAMLPLDLALGADVIVARTIGAFVYALVVVALTLAEQIACCSADHATDTGTNGRTNNIACRNSTHNGTSTGADSGTLLRGRASCERKNGSG